MRTAFVCAVLGIVSCGNIASGNELTNGNLDLTHAVEIVPGFFLPKPDSWVNEGFRTNTGPYEDELNSEAWAGPAPTPVTTDGNANLPFPEGCDAPDCGVFFKAFSGGGANGPATGHLYQDVPAVPGRTYTLTGWAGVEANYLASQTLFALDFLNAGNAVIGGSSLNLVTAGLFTPNGQPFNYKQFTVISLAPVGTVNVRARVSMIDGISNPAGGGQALVVDDFNLTSVPEPSSALTFLGMAGLLIVRRYKRINLAN